MAFSWVLVKTLSRIYCVVSIPSNTGMGLFSSWGHLMFCKWGCLLQTSFGSETEHHQNANCYLNQRNSSETVFFTVKASHIKLYEFAFY